MKVGTSTCAFLHPLPFPTMADSDLTRSVYAQQLITMHPLIFGTSLANTFSRPLALTVRGDSPFQQQTLTLVIHVSSPVP
jgi:hypothetical protein